MDAAFPSITAPRLVVSGLSGGGGKTLLSLGLARALTLRGLRVKPCKKGPDTRIDSSAKFFLKSSYPEEEFKALNTWS